MLKQLELLPPRYVCFAPIAAPGRTRYRSLNLMIPNQDRLPRMIGDSWKDDPLENGQPVRGKLSFLDERGYSDPKEMRIKFELVSLLRTFTESKNLTPEAVLHVLQSHDDTLEIGAIDISRILRGNVVTYSLSILMTVLTALGHDISIVVQSTKGTGQIRLNGRHIA
ncbi:XRE family transcriptional regulator [Dongia sedimenti]|uniref:XRE family transcriptional regulator n=1 Tax=Dongia sedimenti TaxID=3064282 RepID=UPI0036D2E466